MLQTSQSYATAQFLPATQLPALVQALFREVGEDGDREGLKKTPERFAKAMRELTSGYQMEGRDAIGEGIFASESPGPVSVRGVEFFSLCEHHVLPFWGHASVAYIPADKIVGLSKVGRVVDVYAKRLQVQERLTAQIGECLRDAISPRAVMVVLEAQHMCMMMRGVGKVGGSTRTEFFWQDGSVGTAELERFYQQLNQRG